MVLMTGSILLLAIRFHRLVLNFNKNIKLKKSIFIYFLGLAFSITPFSSGSAIKSHIIKKEFDIPIAKTLPIIFIEKWNELVAVLIILSVLLIFSLYFETVVITAIGIVLAVLFFVVIRQNSTFNFIFHITNKLKFLKKFEENIQNSKESFVLLTNKKNSFEGILLTLLSKILESFAIFIVFESFIENVNLFEITQIYFSGILFGFLSFIPGGLGVTEGSMMALLLKFGYDISLVSVSIIVVRLVTIWYSTFLGLLTTKLFAKEKYQF